MKHSNEVYETGATSHAVNDLILFTDNTRGLIEYRDKVYSKWIDKKVTKCVRIVNWKVTPQTTFDNGYSYGWHMPINTIKERLMYDFIILLDATIKTYKQEFPDNEDHSHVDWKNLSANQRNEFLTLYANDFENWKNEHK